MHARKLFTTVFLFLAMSAAHAGMVWTAVAIDPTLIKRLKSDDAFLEQTLDTSKDDQSVYLDKAWHGIHFLLTGQADATPSIASKVIFGGESFGPDQGYGQAQLLTSVEVKEIAELLEKETPERLAIRYDPNAMQRADIYPSIIWVREGKGALDYVLKFYKNLVKFYRQAADHGDAVIFVIR